MKMIKNNQVKPLVYVTDNFLSEYKSIFEIKYLDLYKTKNHTELRNIFKVDDTNTLLTSSKEFHYEELLYEETSSDRLKNIKSLYGNLEHLTPTEAESEKLWVGLSNTYYLDYHLHMLSKASNDKNIATRSHFNQGKKRSLILNNLSSLWWLGYYTYDNNNRQNPYHYTEFLLQNSNLGDQLILLSSNIVSNKNILFGILDGLKELQETKNLKLNRYAYSNSNKILNQIGGTKILDY